MKTERIVALATALAGLAAWGCGPEETCPGGCPGGFACIDGRCVVEDDSCASVYCLPGYTCEEGRCVQDDPCQGVVCSSPGEVCVEGRCVAGDPCEGITCSNPGEVCVDGRCVAGGDDGDGDGYPARDDCDDGDAAVHPGAVELCNGVDDDCDEGTADGQGECAGLCCGSPPSCRECCDGTDCGSGDWSCASYACTCGGVVAGGFCNGDPVCDPGETDRETDDCGWCGSESRSRTCDADGTWGDWGSWSSCTGEGDCDPGSTMSDSEDCGTCGGGTRSRTATCTSSCTWSWGSWSPCTGDVSCTDAFGDAVCPGDTGFRTCPSNPEGFQSCTCSSSGTWTSCTPGCIL